MSRDNIDVVTRIVMEKFCAEMQHEEDQNLHDDDRMPSDMVTGYVEAILDIRKEVGLELFEIDYENNKIIEKKSKPVKKSPKKNNEPQIFTTSDERVFTVKEDLSDIKKMGDVIKGEKWKKELENTYICDECKGRFKGFDVELKPFGKNFGFYNPFNPIRLADANEGYTLSTGDTGCLDKTHEYYTLHCPICHQVHLFGMTIIDPRQVFEVK